jgi:hypothetical protein
VTRHSKRAKRVDNSFMYLVAAAALIFILPNLVNQTPVEGAFPPPVQGSTITVPIDFIFTQGESSVNLRNTGLLSVISNSQTISGAEAKATYTIQGDAQLTGATGGLTLKFDGVAKKTAAFKLGTSTLASLTVTAAEIEAWDNKAYTTHTLTVTSQGGRLTITYPGGLTDQAEYASESISKTVSVTNTATLSIGGTQYPFTLESGKKVVSVSSTISLTQSFDGANEVILRHGPNLGDYPIMSLTGSGVTVKNVVFDDAYYCRVGVWADYSQNKNIGTNGVVNVGGTDNTLTQCTLIRTSRYGLLLGQSLRGKITNCIVTEAQYCISGASGSTNAYWAKDGLISGNTLSGFRLCGVKAKSFDRVTIENNNIDCRAALPSQINNPMGIHFSADSPNLNVLVQNNNIYMSGTDGNSYQFGVHTDTLPLYALPGTIQTGNRIINNNIRNVKYGVYLQMDNFTATGNTFTSVTNPITNYGLNNTVP